MKLILLCLLLAGCASDRLLTKEEDAQIAKECMQGCMVVPQNAWEALMKKLRGSAI